MKSILLFFFTLISFAGLCQTVAVQLSEMNIVYKGIDNPIKIAAEGVSNNELIILTSPFLKYFEGNIITQSQAIKEGYIFIGKKEKTDTTWIDTVKLRIHSLPNPTAQLGGIPNDGLPKGQAAVRAQTTLIATMGSGFAYNLKYRILSYKCIIAYRDKPPLMYSGIGGAITGQMRKAISEMNGGDRILFEGIKAKEQRYGFKANLSPLIVEIRGKIADHKSQIYARIKNEDTNKDTLITNADDIARYQLTLQNGLVDVFAREADGFTLTTSYIFNGKVISWSTQDDYGRLQEIHQRLDSNSWKYTQYYWDGTKKLTTTYTEGQVLKGNDSIAKCIDIAAYWNSLNNDANKECLKDPFIYDIVELYLTKKIAPTHSFTAYYPNGSVRLVGKLVKLTGMEEPEIPSICGNGITYYQYSDHTVMDGKWLLYRENGELLDTQKYKKGVFIR